MTSAPPHDQPAYGPNDIAVIGMACRVPGANTPDEFWALLREGRESRVLLDDSRLRAAGVPQSLLDDPNYVRTAMPLQGMEQFDPAFFGFSPLDGRILDPQHRHFLECSWEAFESAGHDPAAFEGAIGVFAGSGHNAYLAQNLLGNAELVADVGFFLLRHTGNDKDFLTTRVSYCLDLKGPSVNVQTACSTSLVAIHMAAQSLVNGECDMALAGGVTIELPHGQGYLYKDSEILSRDGHCRPFDASAGGTVFGSGCGTVVLRRMEDALAAGDPIHGVLRASAINNDGAMKVSYLAPSVDGQSAAIEEALGIGEIDPATVTYVEAHGTGTQLGDPIEVEALRQAFGGDAAGRQYCGIGSVKSNIGHLDTAAGIASVIKVLLSMRHRQLPATLHWQSANAAIDFAATPFFVNSTLRAWDAPAPLRAGVSSLGVGGTNAHVIVESPPARRSSAARRERQLLTLSARTESSLRRSADRLARFLEDGLESGDATDLADAAFTLATGRRHFRRRAFVVAATAADAVAGLDDFERISHAESPASPATVAFMFAGGGAQHPDMGRQLYASEPIYRAAIDDCLALLREFVDYDVAALLFPPTAAARTEAERLLERPSRTLPALFVTQYAQARLWQGWGITPDALIGHSMGENTAACIAGVLSLRDALGLVALRGRLFEQVGLGSMLSVDLDEADLVPLLGDKLCIAAINAPGLAVASGPQAAIAELEARLAEREIGYRRIRIEVAAHSAMLDPILEHFGDYLRGVRLQPPRIPFISNRSGTWITDAEATDPAYWVGHLRHTVRFADGAGTLLRAQHVLLEVGPGRTLASLAGLHGDKRADQPVLASMRHPEDPTPDDLHMLTTLGRLWLAGAEVNWQAFNSPVAVPGQQRLRVPLPTYAFDHQRCWVEPCTSPLSVQGGGRDAGARGLTLGDWLHEPVWRRMPIGGGRSLRGARVLVLEGDSALAAMVVDALVTALERRGAATRRVRETPAAAQAGATASLAARWTVADDWVRLGDRLQADGWLPTHIVHSLALDLVNAAPPGKSFTSARGKVFDSLFHLAQVAGQEDWPGLCWLALTADAMAVAGEQPSDPLSALLQGPVRVLPREFPGWSSSTLDIESAATHGDRLVPLVERIVDELARPLRQFDGGVIALRGQHRLAQSLLPREDHEGDSVTAPVLRNDGVYLITGGTGGLGLAACAVLAQTAAAAGQHVTIVLLARRPLPAREHWPALIAEGAAEAAAMSMLQALEGGTATILLETGDVTDEATMHALAARLQARHGTMRGILHTAGVVDDAPLLAKDIDAALRVLAPKVEGTLALAQAFAPSGLDFFALYGSSSAYIGLPGQIDYAAANAFLDAFAESSAAQGARVIAIDWPAWKDAGMAANLARGPAAVRLPAGRPVPHPLLDRCVHEDDTRTAFATDFSVARHWVLHEHRIKDGPALLPGSAFVELAHAAWTHGKVAETGTCIEDAYFDLPFVVGDDEHKALHVELLRANGQTAFSLRSESFGDTVEHARGRLLALPQDWRPADLDLAAVRSRCTLGRQSFDDPAHHPFMRFGGRWRALREVLHGPREALVELVLAPEFSDELERFGLHPALYDMATAGAQVVIDGYAPQDEFYVPVGCERLQFGGRFPARAYSHVLYRGPEPEQPDRATFDVTASDEQGRVFLHVTGFRMQRVGDVNAFRQLAPTASGSVAPSLARTLELGVDSREGARALTHVLGARLGPRIAVSPYRLRHVHDALLALAAGPTQAVEILVHDPDADVDIPAIEKGLLECAAITDAVVRAFREPAGERRFVAFFVPDHANFSSTSEIRRFARQHLAAEFVPQQFVEVDELPRLGDGSTDRRALADPLEPADTHAPPRTSIEKALAKTWQDVLGVQRVGLSDNFFDLGGHSLLSTRMIVQVYKRMGVRLDQATIALSTLEQVANEIERRQQGAGAPAAPAGAGGQAGAAQTNPPDAASTGAPARATGKGLLGSLFGRRS